MTTLGKTPRLKIRRSFLRSGIWALWGLAIVLWLDTVVSYSKVISDLIQDYAAGKALRLGREIYGPTIRELAEQSTGFANLDNFHPPFTAIVFAPLSVLSYQQVYYLWNLGALACYALMIVLTMRAYPISGWLRRALPPLLFLWYPFTYAIGTGNISIYVMFLLIAAWSADRNGRMIVAGAVLGLATLLKLFPAIFLLYLFLRRSWRGLTSMLVVIVLGQVACLFLIGSDEMLQYYLRETAIDVRDWGTNVLNVSLFGLLAPLVAGTKQVAPLISAWDGSEGAYQLAQVLSLVIGGVFVAVTLFKFRGRASKSDKAIVYGAFFCLMLLMSPITWMHAFTVLVLPLIFLLHRSQKEGLSAALPLAIFLLFAIPDVSFANLLFDAYAPVRLPIEVFLITRFGHIGLFVLWYVLTFRGSSDGVPPDEEV